MKQGRHAYNSLWGLKVFVLLAHKDAEREEVYVRFNTRCKDIAFLATRLRFCASFIVLHIMFTVMAGECKIFFGVTNNSIEQ